MKNLNRTVVLLMIASLAGCGRQMVEFGDLTPPSIVATNPANAATAVAVNGSISATFNVPMDPATIDSGTFTVSGGAVSISGTVSYANSTATFAPAAPLADGTVYTATITTGASSAASETGLLANYVWTFTTVAVVIPPLPPAPTVTSTNPANNATGVAANQDVSASFSTAMDPATISAATFTLHQGATAISGSVSYAGTIATFAPASALASNTNYTATITAGAKSAAEIGLAANYVWSFTTASIVPPPPPLPQVTSTNPANNATGVATNQDVSASFSIAMDPATIGATTFTLQQGATAVPGNVSYAGTIATFAPLGQLATSTIYTAAITTGAKSAAEVGLAANYVWSFATAAVTTPPPLPIPPQVISTMPGNGAGGVATTQQPSAVFSTAMDPTTINATTFLLTQGTASISGAVSYAGTTANFVPASALAFNTTYTATITTGAKDVAEVGLLANYIWSFTTGESAAQAPTVVATNPANGLASACVPTQISATFSQAMDSTTIDAMTFTLSSPGPTPINGAVTYDSNTLVATFAPSSSLIGGTNYSATVTAGAKDLSGTPLASNKVWTFATSTTPCTMPVNIRSLSSFVAVAGAGLTNSNTQLPAVTTLNGDVGLSPSATCLSDGSVCNPAAGAPRINGVLYANDPAGKAAAAKADLVSAYNDAQGRPPGTIISANLAGQVLAPGVYTSQPASSMDIAVNGILTLDAQGDQNGTWIFQIGSTLTANNGCQVKLINGAKAANVFWAVGSSSTIGTNVDFKGTVMATQSNSVGTGSTVEGRLVCTTGAITLLSNVITLPSP